MIIIMLLLIDDLRSVGMTMVDGKKGLEEVWVLRMVIVLACSNRLSLGRLISCKGDNRTVDL